MYNRTIAVLALILAISAVAIFTTQKPDLKDFILYAQRNADQNPPPSNPDNLVEEFNLRLFALEDGYHEDIALLKSSLFINKFFLRDDHVYFANQQNLVELFDLDTKKSEIVNIPGIEPQVINSTKNTLNDFRLIGDEIIYLKGICSDNEYCVAGVYNLKTRKNEILTPDLGELLKPGNMHIIYLSPLPNNQDEVGIMTAWGDAGWWSGTLYEIDRTRKMPVKIDSFQRSPCEPGWEECTAELIAENTKTEDLLKIPDQKCGEGAISISTYDFTVYHENTERNYKAAYYIGCTAHP